MNDRDLSGMTSPPRSDALRGTLQVPAAPPAREDTEEPAPAEGDTETGAASTEQDADRAGSARGARRTSQQGSRRGARGGTGSGSRTAQQRRARDEQEQAVPQERRQKRSVVVYVPGSLVDELKASKRVLDTHTDWVLDAFDQHDQALEEVYPPLPQRRSGLPPKRRPRRRGGETRKPLQLRLDEEELAALDRRREQLQVESRSEFVTTVIELGLGRTPAAAA